MTINSTAATRTQRCPACGVENNCAMAASNPASDAQQCWCMAEPFGAALPASSAASCYCRTCLRALSAPDNQPTD